MLFYKVFQLEHSRTDLLDVIIVCYHVSLDQDHITDLDVLDTHLGSLLSDPLYPTVLDRRLLPFFVRFSLKLDRSKV